MGDAIALRLQYGWFDIIVPRLVQEQLENILRVSRLVLTALELIDTEARSGEVRVSHTAHLRLESNDGEAYVGDRLNGGDDALTPDAFAFDGFC